MRPVRWARPLLLGTGALLLLLALFWVWQAVGLRRDMLRAQRELNQAVAVAEPLLSDPARALQADAPVRESAAYLMEADAALASARRRVRLLWPALWIGAQLPGWPQGLRDLPPLIDTARGLTQAGVELSTGAVELRERLDVEDGSAAGARLASSLEIVEPRFRTALNHLQRAQASRATVDAERLRGPLSPARAALDTFDRQAGRLLANADLLGTLPQVARGVLGMEGPRTYAVLGQNSAELRPTGGFLGSLGLVTLERGALVAEEYRGVYTWEDPTKPTASAPRPLQLHLGGTPWGLRDANWSPDFPQSVQAIEQFLQYYREIRVDGVIGFTTGAVGPLLEVLGPVQVPGVAESFTAATWYEQAERSIYFADPANPFAEAEQNKGEVLGPLLQAVMRRIQGATTAELPAILRAMRRLVEERQLLLLFHDNAATDLLRRSNADGRFAPPERGDVLAVVDANLSYSKVGPFIDQTITYDAWLDDRAVPLESRVTVEYRNRITPEQARDPQRRVGGIEFDATTAQFITRPGVYGTYARVFVPPRSRLLDIGPDEQAAQVTGELGFTTFERYTSVPAAEVRSLSYAWVPPAERFTPGLYTLQLVKQPGTVGPLVTLRFYLPEGVHISATVPVTREGEAIVFRDRLRTNLTVQLQVEP